MPRPTCANVFLELALQSYFLLPGYVQTTEIPRLFMGAAAAAAGNGSEDVQAGAEG